MEKSGFHQFGLHTQVQRGVSAAGYEQPTPIQEQAIPGVIDGRDILGLAQTGTGKTAAFLLPILHRLLQEPKRGVVRALILAPTRELAEQINTDIRQLGKFTRIKSATVYGGVGYNPQIRALNGGAEIIVACPGRLLDLLESGQGRINKLEMVVLDEADQMFDMGFLPQVRKILNFAQNAQQNLLFSATMPKEIRHLANDMLKDPITIEIAHSKPAETIEHSLVAVTEQQKTELLSHLIDSQDLRSVLVFTRTKQRAKRLAERLDKGGTFVSSIHGDLSQRQRQRALDGFKRGNYHVLVATDVASRGIDVAGVSHVINYDFPDTPEAYTHRIGRTGRASLSGEALTFVLEKDFGSVLALEKQLEMRIDRVENPIEFAPHADQLETLEERKGGRRGRGGRPGGGRPGGRGNRPGGRNSGSRSTRGASQRGRGPRPQNQSNRG